MLDRLAAWRLVRNPISVLRRAMKMRGWSKLLAVLYLSRPPDMEDENMNKLYVSIRQLFNGEQPTVDLNALVNVLISDLSRHRQYLACVATGLGVVYAMSRNSELAKHAWALFEMFSKLSFLAMCDANQNSCTESSYKIIMNGIVNIVNSNPELFS